MLGVTVSAKSDHGFVCSKHRQSVLVFQHALPASQAQLSLEQTAFFPQVGLVFLKKYIIVCLSHTPVLEDKFLSRKVQLTHTQIRYIVVL
jgi:hypothetical protein